MSVTKKLTLLVIGKSAKPRCFKRVNVSNLGIYYRFNKKAWMTAQIFREWLLKIDKIFLKQGRKILLFVDNFSGHNFEGTLTNVKLVYFPANCTSILQPLDQGIIASFKVGYRTLIIRRIVEKLDSEVP